MEPPPARKYRGTWNSASCPDGSPRLRGNFRRKGRSAFQKKRGSSLFIANPDNNRFLFCLFVMSIIVLIILVPIIKIALEYRREKNEYIKLHTVYKYETYLASRQSTQSSTKTLEVPQYPCTTYQQDAYFPSYSTLRIQLMSAVFMRAACGPMDTGRVHGLIEGIVGIGASAHKQGKLSGERTLMRACPCSEPFTILITRAVPSLAG